MMAGQNPGQLCQGLFRSVLLISGNQDDILTCPRTALTLVNGPWLTAETGKGKEKMCQANQEQDQA
jgi:hypothetical protein